ncbi:MAG: gluconokinase [Rubrivivax sp.]|nr:gluconokinase [Rubrivivax sp.]
MGVSGCGKTTVGRALAVSAAWRYVEGDELHPPENVALMAAGTPLTDANRQGWLEKIAAMLANATRSGEGLVVTCSALKRRYRDLLRGGDAQLRFVFLHGPRELLAERMAARQGHYMPPSLLLSQLEALEPPQADEGALGLPIGPAPEALAAVAETWLRRCAAPTGSTAAKPASMDAASADTTPVSMSASAPASMPAAMPAVMPTSTPASPA